MHEVFKVWRSTNKDVTTLSLVARASLLMVSSGGPTKRNKYEKKVRTLSRIMLIQAINLRVECFQVLIAFEVDYL